MRRSLAIFFWILAGGIAAGLSVGFFLYKSNFDRAGLVAELAEARAQSEEAKQQNEAVAADANEKIREAEKTVDRIRAELTDARAEILLVASAIPLVSPPPRSMRGWSEQLSIPLGIALKTPPDIKTQIADDALLLGPAASHANPAMDQRVSFTRYQVNAERDLVSRLRDTTPVVYTVAGHWLYGTKGKYSDLPGEVLVLRAQTGQTETHLIWARVDEAFSERRLQDILSTLRFPS